MTVSPEVLAAFVAAVFGGSGLLAVFLKWLEVRQSKPVNELVNLAEVQRQIREEVRVENAGLREDIAAVKAALISLTDVIDEILPGVQGLTAEQQDRLRRANNTAKMAV